MKSQEAQVAVTLSRLTTLLIKENFIQDDETLHSTISTVLQKYIKSPSPVKQPRPSERLSHITKMLENAQKNKEKLEILRRKLDESQDEHIKKVPTIDENSKKICINFTKNIIQRSEIDLKNRNDKLKKSREQKLSQENEEFKKNCSFSPLTKGKCSRHPAEVVRDLYEWKGTVGSKLQKRQEESEKMKLKEVYSIPRIQRTKFGIKSAKSQNTSRIERSMANSKSSIAKSSNQLISETPRRDLQKIDTSKYSYEEIVKMLSCNSSFS